MYLPAAGTPISHKTLQEPVNMNLDNIPSILEELLDESVQGALKKNHAPTFQKNPQNPLCRTVEESERILVNTTDEPQRTRV